MINQTIAGLFDMDLTLSGNNFFLARNLPNNVYIDRKLKFWRIQKFKNFFIFSAFLHPKRYIKFLMENCEIVDFYKSFWIFGFEVQLTAAFLFGKSLWVKKIIFILFMHFCTQNGNFLAKLFLTHKSKFWKNRKFSIFSNLLKNGSRSDICIKKCFLTSCELISEYISWNLMILSYFTKIEFSWFLDFLGFSRFFRVYRFGCKKGLKMSKFEIFFKNVSIRPKSNAGLNIRCFNAPRCDIFERWKCMLLGSKNAILRIPEEQHF